MPGDEKKTYVDSSVTTIELSPTQIELLTLLARGHSYGEIAGHMNLSQSGVQYHIQQLRQLLRIHSLPAIVAKVIVGGVLTNNRWPVEPTGAARVKLKPPGL